MKPEDETAQVQFEQIVLQKIKLAAVMAIPDGMHDALANATFRTEHDWMADHLVGKMTTYIWGLNEQRITAIWPRDWWQAVKQRFAPAWFLRRWPVLCDQIDQPQFEAVYLALHGDKITADPGRHGSFPFIRSQGFDGPA